MAKSRPCAALRVPGTGWTAWQRATARSPTAAARRSRLAAATLWVLLAMVVAALVLAWLDDPVATLDENDVVTAFSFLAITGAALLAQRGWPDLGVGLATLTLMAAVWVMRLLAPTVVGTPDVVLFFLAIPVLLAGLLMRLRWAVTLVVIVLGVSAVLEPITDVKSGLPARLDAADLAIGIVLGLAAGLALTTSVLVESAVRLTEAQAESLATANQALEGAASDRRRMLDQVAHDLGNPLMALSVQVKVLELPGIDLAKSTAVIKRSAGKLRRQVEDLKDLSRIEGGALRLAKARIDLGPVVRDVAAGWAAAGTGKGIDVQANVANQIPVVADEARVGQVLDNLLSNAFKFTSSGGRINIDATVEEPQAVVCVKDSGRGMTAEELGKLFKAFSQAHALGEVEERGSGLGLFIAKGIVEAHGGTLQAASQGLGHGSTFTIRLPLADSKLNPVAP